MPKKEKIIALASFIGVGLFVIGSVFYIYNKNINLQEKYNADNLNFKDTQLGLLSEQPDDFTVGSSDPLVRLVVYTDTDCPFCARYEPRLQQLLRNRPDDISITYRNINLLRYPTSRFEQQVLECVGKLTDSYTYVEFQSKYLLNRPSNENDSNYVDLINAASLFTERQLKTTADIRNCVEDQGTTDQLKRKQKIGRLLGVGGTPTTFLVSKDGGTKTITGSRTYEDLIQDIKNFETNF